MDWTEIAITVPAEDVDRAGDIAQMVVPYGIYIEDYSNLEQEAWEIAHIDLIDEELLNKMTAQRYYTCILQSRRKSCGSHFIFAGALHCRRNSFYH